MPKMTFEVKIRYSLECTDRKDGMAKVIDIMNNCGIKTFVVEHIPNSRSDAQNRAIHLFYTLLSNALNEYGIDMRHFIAQHIHMPWTPHNIKEYIWRPLQVATTGKKSTRKITTEEINVIYDTINQVVSDRTNGNVHVPFPSIDTMIDRSN